MNKELLRAQIERWKVQADQCEPHHRAYLEAQERIRELEQREKPAHDCCTEIFGKGNCGICAEAVQPAGERFTLEQIEKAFRGGYNPDNGFVADGQWRLFLARLSPPKPQPKTPQERVEEILFRHYNGIVANAERHAAAEIIAELGKEKP